MEPEYEQLLSWEDPGPAVPGEDATEPNKPWGDGITPGNQPTFEGKTNTQSHG